jgi:hypothetical protein
MQQPAPALMALGQMALMAPMELEAQGLELPAPLVLSALEPVQPELRAPASRVPVLSAPELLAVEMLVSEPRHVDLEIHSYYPAGQL